MDEETDCEETLSEYVKAVLEGRLATAAFLYPRLPPVDMTGVVVSSELITSSSGSFET